MNGAKSPRVRVRDFRSIKAWEKGHRLALDLYRATSNFPREEVFGLTSQLRHAGVSIPANIAEGAGRGSAAELARFCLIAFGSASEVEALLLIARDLAYLTENQHSELERAVVEVKRITTAFAQSLKAEG